MATPSRGQRKPYITPKVYEVTEEDILKHILFWKHIPNRVSFNDKSLQTILEAYNPKEDINTLASNLQMGTPAHKRAVDLIEEVMKRPTISSDKESIIDMFNWLRFSEHMDEVNKEPIPFNSKMNRALEFSPAPRDLKIEPTLFEDLQKYREEEANPESNTALNKFDLGLDSLNQVTEFAHGNFMIIAARPGSGKTALSLFFGLTNALKGKKVMFLSLEMAKKQLLKRINNFMRAKSITEEQQKNLPFIIKYGAPNILSDFKTYIKNEIDIHQPDILIIDYVQLFSERNSRNRFDVIAEASKFFKNLAMNSNLGLITCSQVARATTTFGVTLDSLFGSSELEADADIVFAIERGDAGVGGEILQPAVIKLLKNRDGEPVIVEALVNYASMNVIEDPDMLLFKD